MTCKTKRNDIKNIDLKCIIFDFDDTLYTGEVWENWDKFLQDCYEKALPHKAFKKTQIGFLSGAAFVDLLLKEGLPASTFVKYQEENIYKYSTNEIDIISPKLLEKLRDKYKLAIVSNSSVPYVKYHLKEFKVDEKLFDEIQQNNFLEEDRTKALNYKDIMKKYNLKPENVLVMGDSYSNDIAPALKLGLFHKHINTVKEVEQYLNMIIKEDYSFLN